MARVKKTASRLSTPPGGGELLASLLRYQTPLTFFKKIDFMRYLLIRFIGILVVVCYAMYELLNLFIFSCSAMWSSMRGRRW
jgi:hypothetical protein